MNTNTINDFIEKCIYNNLEKAQEHEAQGNLEDACKLYLKSASLSLELSESCNCEYSRLRLKKEAEFYKEKAESLLSTSTVSHMSGNSDEKELNIEDYIIHRPDIKITDLKGYEIRDMLSDCIFRLSVQLVSQPRELILPATQAIFLNGYPGTGKTTFAQAIANFLNIPIICISGDELISKYLGESSKKLRQAFIKASSFAEKKKKKVILLLEEIDGLLSIKNASSELDENERIRSSFKSLIGGTTVFKNIFLIATSNQHRLDEPLLQRFGKIYNFKLPDKDTRRDILEMNLVNKGYILKSDISLDTVADKLENQAGREIVDFCHDLKFSMLKRKNPSLASLNGKRPLDLTGYELIYEDINHEDIEYGFSSLKNRDL